MLEVNLYTNIHSFAHLQSKFHINENYPDTIHFLLSLPCLFTGSAISRAEFITGAMEMLNGVTREYGEQALNIFINQVREETFQNEISNQICNFCYTKNRFPKQQPDK